MDPGFHCVRTHWIRGFMAFQLARRTRIVMLVVLVGPESGCLLTPGVRVSVAQAAPHNLSGPGPAAAPRSFSAPKCQTSALSSNRHRIRLDIRTNLGSNRWSNAGRVR